MNNQYSKAILSELGHVSYGAQSAYTEAQSFPAKLPEITNAVNSWRQTNLL